MCGVLEIITSLKSLLLQFSRGSGVERRYGQGCQDREGASRGVMFRDPLAGDANAIAVRILRTKTGCNGSGGEGQTRGEEHMQERAEIHFGISCAR